MTPSQQTIQLIRDAIVSGNQQDAEKALQDFKENNCIEILGWLVENENAHVAVYLSQYNTTNNPNKIYQLFNQSK